MDCLGSIPLRVPSYVIFSKGLGFLICKMGEIVKIIATITTTIKMIIPPTS